MSSAELTAPLANLAVPTGPETSLPISIHAGRSIVFVGANGSGKTRLGVLIEKVLRPGQAQRISAQRALQFSTNIQMLDFDSALSRLIFGIDQRSNPHIQVEQFPLYKEGSRWGSKPATHLLADYEAVLQALFADETKQALLFRQSVKAGQTTAPPTTRFDRLIDIWGQLLPHRSLIVSDGELRVRIAGRNSESYHATELSDGEKVMLHLIGQALLLTEGGILIVDEPEIHVHRALMTKLWDALEADRDDCGFIYLTHDLEFAASRFTADKYGVQHYRETPSQAWDVQRLPTDEVLPEEIVGRILGSRQPVLFVEGDAGGLDTTVFRALYKGHTVIPVGGCEAVINSVAAFSRNRALHRVDVSGVIDADGRTTDDQRRLSALSVYLLPVSEIENLFLLPEPSCEHLALMATTLPSW